MLHIGIPFVVNETWGMTNLVDKPIEVVHLINSLDVGGAERMLTQLLIHGDKSRVRHRIICMLEPGPMADSVSEHAAGIETLGMKRGAPAPGALWRLVRLLRNSPCDVLQTWLYHADLIGLIAGRLAGIRHIAWNTRCSSTGNERIRPLTTWIVKLLAYLSAWPDLVIANAEIVRTSHEEMGYRPKRWVHLPNGFDINRFRPSPERSRAFRESLGISEDMLVIGMVARYQPRKDFDGLLAAFALIMNSKPELRLILVGSGTNSQNTLLVEQVNRYGVGDRVHLLGERSDVERILPGLDLFVLASFGEGFPNVVGEAMACGVPCVMTDVGNAAELLGQTGCVVPINDAAALARAIENMLAEDSFRIQRAAAARARIEQYYSIADIARQYEVLYESMVK